ncbi:MAG TPA: hypothetical protein VMV49_18280 [Candidatus Deferrimicrobium sp.]|nr:hypothetical protein [Candidatus Deferrimicrobium sp.]
MQEKAQIVKSELLHEMDLGLEYIQVCIGSMYGGITGWFLNPIARLIYNIMARKDIREKAIAQIDIVLDCAIKYDGKNLEVLLEDNFEDYLLNDQSFHRCKKSHKTYPIIEGIMKELFKSRIEPAHKLLSSNGTCYEELTQSAYAEKQNALDNLQRELGFSYKVLSVVKENKKVMKLPSFTRDSIIKIMELGQKYAKERLTQRIDEIYEFNGHK